MISGTEKVSIRCKKHISQTRWCARDHVPATLRLRQPTDSTVPSSPSRRERLQSHYSQRVLVGVEPRRSQLSPWVLEHAGSTYTSGRSCTALPGGQPAATQAQKHQGHSCEVISEEWSSSSYHPSDAHCAPLPLPLRKSEPIAEVGLAGQKLVCGLQGLERRVSPRKAQKQLDPRGHHRLLGVRKEQPNEPQRHPGCRDARPCTAESNWNPASPAAPQPPQTGCHGNAFTALPPWLLQSA